MSCQCFSACLMIFVLVLISVSFQSFSMLFWVYLASFCRQAPIGVLSCSVKCSPLTHVVCCYVIDTAHVCTLWVPCWLTVMSCTVYGWTVTVVSSLTFGKCRNCVMVASWQRSRDWSYICTAKEWPAGWRGWVACDTDKASSATNRRPSSAATRSSVCSVFRLSLCWHAMSSVLCCV